MKKYNIYGYSFNELKKDVQEKVLNNMRYTDVEYVGWWNFAYDYIENEILPKYGITSENINEDLHFETDSYDNIRCYLNLCSREIDIEKIFELCNIELPHKSLWDKYNLYDYLSYKITKREFLIEIDYSLPRLNKCLDNINAIINEKLKDIFNELEKTINDEYKWLTSDEHIKNYISCDEYVFMEDGKSLPLYAKEA